MMSGQKKLIENWVSDFKKKEINHFERAKIIDDYIKSENISQREFAKRLDIHHNTIQDWMLWNSLTEKEYKSLLKKGLTDTDIYRTLRDGKKEKKKELLGITKLDSDLKSCIKKLKPHANVNESSAKTAVLIHELQGVLVNILGSMKLAEYGNEKK